MHFWGNWGKSTPKINSTFLSLSRNILALFVKFRFFIFVLLVGWLLVLEFRVLLGLFNSEKGVLSKTNEYFQFKDRTLLVIPNFLKIFKFPRFFLNFSCFVFILLFSKRNLSNILNLCFDGNYSVEWI